MEMKGLNTVHQAVKGGDLEEPGVGRLWVVTWVALVHHQDRYRLSG